MSNHSEFKRLNFFTGFFTTADDWNEGQQYHLEKRKLHNRLLHSQGIMEGLEVAPHEGLTVLVKKGAALDSAGNLIYLARDTPITLTPPATSAARVFVVVEYREDTLQEDYDYNVQDPDYRGYKRTTEVPSIVTTTTPAANQIELASVYLRADATEVTAPDNPGKPKEDELDLRGRSWAGAIDDRRDGALDATQEHIARLYEHLRGQFRSLNQGLHTAGLLCHVLDELDVQANGGMGVVIKPGAALDVDGRYLFLEHERPLTIAAPAENGTVYIVARYDDRLDNYLPDFDQPFENSLSTALIETTNEEPDNQSAIELARIALSADTTEITDHDGEGDPPTGSINRHFRTCAKSKDLAQQLLEKTLRERIEQLLETTREEFIAVARRFPNPVVDDVRHVVLTFQMALDDLRLDQLAHRFKTIAAVEKSVEQELGATYPPLTRKSEYIAFQDAISALVETLRDRPAHSQLAEWIDLVVNRQGAVTLSAHELAQVVFPPPYADAGADVTQYTPGDSAVVSLDAGGSTAAEGHEIVRYRWEKEQ